MRRIRKLLAIVDDHVGQVALVRETVAAWRKTGLNVVFTSRRSGEPTYDELEELRTVEVSGTVEAVVGIGGGSTIDVAKGLAVLATNPGPALDYRGFDRFSKRPLPIVAVPTIAGSGSEVTPNASFVDIEDNRKLGINGAELRPVLAVLDPELTVSAPSGTTMGSGFDALVHAVEAHASRHSTVLAQCLAREAVGIVSNALLRIKEVPNDLEARERLLVGAGLAAYAMLHSGTGPAAALSYPVGVWLGIPHGRAGAMFLPEVVAWNVERGVESYADLLPFCAAGEVVERGDDGGSRLARARRFAGRLQVLRTRLGLDGRPEPPPDAAMVRRLAEGLAPLQAALDSNPVPFSGDDGRRLLQEVLGVRDA